MGKQVLLMGKGTKEMPSLDVLNEIFYLKRVSGVLVWKSRARKWFKRNQDFITWNKRWEGKVAGNLDVITGYWRVRLFGCDYLGHRLIYKMLHGSCSTALEIDHKDGNRLNNREGNLRLVTPRENGKNKFRLKNNTTGVTGVSRKRSKFEAYIGVNGKTIRLGCFSSVDEAALARAAADTKYNFHKRHGEIRNPRQRG